MKINKVKAIFAVTISIFLLLLVSVPFVEGADPYTNQEIRDYLNNYNNIEPYLNASNISDPVLDSFKQKNPQLTQALYHIMIWEKQVEALSSFNSIPDSPEYAQFMFDANKRFNDLLNIGTIVDTLPLCEISYFAINAPLTVLNSTLSTFLPVIEFALWLDQTEITRIANSQVQYYIHYKEVDNMTDPFDPNEGSHLLDGNGFLYSPDGTGYFQPDNTTPAKDYLLYIKNLAKLVYDTKHKYYRQLTSERGSVIVEVKKQLNELLNDYSYYINGIDLKALRQGNYVAVYNKGEFDVENFSLVNLQIWPLEDQVTPPINISSGGSAGIQPEFNDIDKVRFRVLGIDTEINFSNLETEVISMFSVLPNTIHYALQDINFEAHPIPVQQYQSYEWDLGDGTIKYGNTIVHQYSKPGRYLVNLKVTSTTGYTDSISKIVVITNPLTAPSNFANELQGSAPLTVNFDASSTVCNIWCPPSYHWDFGDGQSADGLSTSHTYQSPGTYYPKLTVSLSADVYSTSEMTIKVSAIISGTVTYNGSGLNNVTVTLSGDASKTATTVSDGTYSFTGLTDGTYTITPSLSGHTFNPPSRTVTVSGGSITGVDFTSSSTPIDLNNGLVAYWSFDNCDATDDSGNGLDGAIYGVPLCVDGPRGKTLSFNGNGDWIRIPYSDKFNFSPTDSFTLSAFVNPDVISNWGAIMVKSPANGVWDYGLYYSGNLQQFMSGYHNTHILWSNQINASSSLFYHLVVVYSNCLWTLYLDGVLQDTASTSCITSSSGALGIGKKGDSTSDYFKGFIDDVRIYNRALSDAEIQALYNTGSSGGVIQLPKTGQTTCYDSAGNMIACSGTGQDGEIQAGVAWPDPRFTVGTGAEADCVTDNLTGLMWARNGNLLGGSTNWYSAIDYANNLTLCGYADWVLPNINELESLVNANEPNLAAWLNTQGFYNVWSSPYWLSTTSALDTNHAGVIFMWDGSVFYDGKDYFSYVWPVRSRQTGIIQIPKTGQTTSYYTGDDGDLERGVAWPNPRFTDNGNETVTDNLTGLVWSKDTNPHPSECGTYNTWQGALDYVKCLNNNSYLNYTDWRLPNTNEFRSLMDYSRYNPALPLGHPFINVQYMFYYYGYWTSTTGNNGPYGKGFAWVVFMWYGNMMLGYKDAYYNGYYVWPVRSGQVGAVSFNYYCDDDNDGYFDSVKDGTCSGSGCVPVGCQTIQGNDCNDNDPSINPGATEVCDGLDNDCDGSVDEGCNVDLYVSSLSAPILANSGDTILVSDTTNKSGMSLVGTTTTKIYFSKDNKYSTSDIYLGERAVPAFSLGAQSSSGSTSVTIPSNACTQTYYLIARADADKVITEWNEGNNNRAVAIQITNNNPPVDFYVSSVTVPGSANAGDTISVSDTTNKSGRCAIGVSTTKIYLSTDNKYSTSDIYLGERAVGAFGAGAGNNSGSTDVTIPSGTPAGTYYIIVRADADKVITEWNEGNNNRAGAITIGP